MCCTPLVDCGEHIGTPADAATQKQITARLSIRHIELPCAIRRLFNMTSTPVRLSGQQHAQHLGLWLVIAVEGWGATCILRVVGQRPNTQTCTTDRSWQLCDKVHVGSPYFCDCVWRLPAAQPALPDAGQPTCTPNRWLREKLASVNPGSCKQNCMSAHLSFVTVFGVFTLQPVLPDDCQPFPQGLNEAAAGSSRGGRALCKADVGRQLP
jgi:hypothetical protein